MIKGNVKIDELVKLENNMASIEDLKGMDSKEELKGMDRKEYLQYLKELMKDVNITLFLMYLLKKRIRMKNMTYSNHV